MKNIVYGLFILLTALGLSTFTDEAVSTKAIDQSHVSQGYVTVHKPASADKVVAVVETYDQKYSYRLDTDTAVLPLQMGDAEYTVTLYENEEGRTVLDQAVIQVEMDNELACFLHPNLYVNYTSDSPWVQQARKLTKGISEPLLQYKAISDYVARYFVYDYIKSVTVEDPDNAIPDLERCWDTKMGISQDLAALACAMFRSQGFPAMLVRGTQEYNSIVHYWTLVYVDNNWVIFDPMLRYNAIAYDNSLYFPKDPMFY